MVSYGDHVLPQGIHAPMLFETPEGLNPAAVLMGALKGALEAAQAQPLAQSEKGHKEKWDAFAELQAFVAERLAVACGASKSWGLGDDPEGTRTAPARVGKTKTPRPLPEGGTNRPCARG